MELFEVSQNPLLLAKDLIRTAKAKNKQLVNNVNDQLIDLRNSMTEKKKFLKITIRTK